VLKKRLESKLNTIKCRRMNRRTKIKIRRNKIIKRMEM